MNEKESITYSPTETMGGAPKEQGDKNKITERLTSLVERQEYESEYQKGFFQRETHSKKGEHILLVYNDHSTLTKRYLPPQCFIQVYLPGHTKAAPRMEEYKWTLEQDPEELYPDRIERIESLMGIFESEFEDVSGEA